MAQGRRGECLVNKRRPVAVTRRKHLIRASRAVRARRLPVGRRRRSLSPVVISPRPRLRQPLITRLLMRPAAVCNHPGPRRAGAGVVGRRQAEEGAEA